MSDLISRQALCEYALNQKDKSVTPNDIMRFPSAQPEIIHCRDCKYWNPYSMKCEGIGNWFGFEGAWEENGYCYKAKRRNDG